MRAVAALALLLASATAVAAPADDDDVTPRSIVFARGDKLIKADGRGKSETTLATLLANATVRALRTDANGTVLLADLDGTWSFMRLDGRTQTLTALPCQAGPAQLSVDGTYVLCRGKTTSLVVNLRSGKQTLIDVPTPGARLVGSGTGLRLVWADARGIWNGIPPQNKAPKRVAAQPPLRSFLVSPDGTRAVGVYADEVYENAHRKHPAEVLMEMPLDGSNARRKVIQHGVPLEWSHDGQWVLVQDGKSACIMRIAGGQYKCWKGYTAAAIAPDGKYALVFGRRDMPKPPPAKKTKKTKGKAAKRAPDPEPEGEAEEPTDAPADEASDDDVALAPPGGPVALYRAELDGAFTKSPVLVTRDVAGAAVWVP
jgi:hypothetical protein